MEPTDLTRDEHIEARVYEIINHSRIMFLAPGRKTVILHCTLPNGFEIVETAHVIDPEGFSEAVGREVCAEKLQQTLRDRLAAEIITAEHGSLWPAGPPLDAPVDRPV